MINTTTPCTDLEAIGNQLLDRADEFLRKAKPFPRPHRIPGNATVEYVMSRLRMQKQHQDAEASPYKEHFTKFINLTAMRHTSLVSDLKKLEPIYLKDMTVNKVHSGKYLLCKALTEPFYSACTISLIRDEKDDVENLRMYNCSPDLSIDPSLLLPANSILIIKEPLLISDMDDLNDCFIRVESPTDIVIVSDLDYTPELDKYLLKKWLVESGLTYEQLNVQGNKFFADKNYYQAVRSYTQALNWCVKNKTGSNRDIKKTLNNRSLANLRLERFYPAYQDALRSSQIVLENIDEAVSHNEKSYFRMGKALYSMREYSDSVIWFTKCIELNHDNLEACAELARAKERIRESETGKFDTKKIIEDCKAGQLRLDVGDYVSPDIEVSSLNNNPNYKGVVAKSDIKKNTLLVGTKALSVAFGKELSYKNKNKIMKVNHQLRKLMGQNLCLNVQNLINKMQYDPFMAKKLNKLYAGPNVDRDKPISETIVDTKRIEATVILSSFACGSYGIINDDDGKDKETNGIFFFPAFFNHSCVPNVTVLTCNDFMMLYSTRDIKKGEELTLMYLAWAPYKRRVTFFEGMGFKCGCVLCELDSKDSNLSAREAYVEKTQNELEEYLKKMTEGKKKPDVKLANQFVKRVRQMYVDNRAESLKVDVVQALNLQAKFYLHASDAIRLAEIYVECFEILRDTVKTSALDYLFFAIKYFYLGSRVSEVKKWLKIAKFNCRGDKHIFEHLCRSNLDEVSNIDQLLKQI